MSLAVATLHFRPRLERAADVARFHALTEAEARAKAWEHVRAFGRPCASFRIEAGTEDRPSIQGADA